MINNNLSALKNDSVSINTYFIYNLKAHTFIYIVMASVTFYIIIVNSSKKTIMSSKIS